MSAAPSSGGRGRSGRHGGVQAPGLRQVSLARLREFGVVPKRELGQNFLVDDNLLGVILDQLDCQTEDVVLEVGAGLGVLTKALANVARHVHAFELDRSLRAPLEATLEGDREVTLHFEDVLHSPLEKLAPAPTVCASNLPYSVAGPFLAEALVRLPKIRRYCIMVQREVAERLTAVPGTKAYGVLSVWVQLYATVLRTRPLSRAIFYPQPRVDSTLVVLDRLPVERLPSLEPEQLRKVLQAAFGQRRKTLANSLSARSDVTREWVLAWIREVGLPADVRAERLGPKQFAELAERITQT